MFKPKDSYRKNTVSHQRMHCLSKHFLESKGSIKYKVLKQMLFSEKTAVPKPHTLTFDLFCSDETLKIRAKSPKPNQVFIMP